MSALDVALRASRELKEALAAAYDTTTPAADRLGALRAAVWLATTSIDCARLQDERDGGGDDYLASELRKLADSDPDVARAEAALDRALALVKP